MWKSFFFSTVVVVVVTINQRENKKKNDRLETSDYFNRRSEITANLLWSDGWGVFTRCECAATLSDISSHELVYRVTNHRSSLSRRRRHRQRTRKREREKNRCRVAFSKPNISTSSSDYTHRSLSKLSTFFTNNDQSFRLHIDHPRRSRSASVSIGSSLPLGMCQCLLRCFLQLHVLAIEPDWRQRTGTRIEPKCGSCRWSHGASRR